LSVIWHYRQQTKRIAYLVPALLLVKLAIIGMHICWLIQI